MAGKKGYRNVIGMRHRLKGGADEAVPDNFDRSSSITFASLLDEWIQRMEERAYSPKTLRIQKWSLKAFIKWCEENDLNDPKQITKPILETYQRYLYQYRKEDGKPLSVATQRNRLGFLQRFFAWMCRENILPANPAADLELPRKPAKLLPKALSRDEIKSLFTVPDTTDVLGLRDRCILEVFYSCGLRRSELTNLNLEDLDASRGVLSVIKGKGGKSRTLPVGERTLNWLLRYLEKSRPHLVMDENDRSFFLSGYGGKFSPSYLGKWMKEIMVSVGINKEGSCHLLRHSTATHMLENGADIRFIQQMLGHSSLETTSIYTEVSITQLREVHSRTHPHAK